MSLYRAGYYSTVLANIVAVAAVIVDNGRSDRAMIRCFFFLTFGFPVAIGLGASEED